MIRFRTIVTAWAILALSCGIAGAARETTTETAERLAERIFGYASVFNVSRMEELAATGLANDSYTTAQRARLIWARAFGYVSFMTEYRTDKYEEAYEKDLRQLVEIDPGLLADEIPNPHANYRLRVPQTTAPEEIRRRLDGLLEEARGLKNPAAIASWTGHAFNAAGHMEDPETSAAQQYRNEALRYFRAAAAERPGSYYCVLWLADTLAVLKKNDEAEKVADAMARIFQASATLYSDDSPAFRAAVYKGATEPNAKPVIEYVPDFRNDPQLINDAALERLTKSIDSGVAPSADTLRKYAALAHEWETSSSLPAWRLKRLARLYYRLAHLYNLSGDLREALRTYDRLGRISPHYAEIHLNRAVILTILADGTQLVPEKKDRLRNALEECQMQKTYNWHGTAAEYADRTMKKISARLEKLD